MIKNINTIEKNILLNPYVKKLKLYQDLNNRLLVDIVQFNPIARIVSEKDKDLYVDLDGNIFPTSIKFSEIFVCVSIYFMIKVINTTFYIIIY